MALRCRIPSQAWSKRFATTTSWKGSVAAAWVCANARNRETYILAERHTGMKLSGWLHSLAQDLRYGLRLLRLNPGFTAIVVLSLALGTGANTAIFQLIDSLRLRTLPVAHPEQLANVRILDRSWNSGRVHGRYADITNAQWEQIRDHPASFFRHVCMGDRRRIQPGARGRSTLRLGHLGQRRFFKTLEVPAFRGRTI